MANKFIAAAYKLYTTDNTTPVEEATEQQPFVFISGLGMALDAFEKNIEELPTGKAFDFTIPCDDAYGAPDQERIIALPRGIFEVNGQFDDEHIKVDAFIPMNNADGQRLIGKVIDITDENVLMDFNHPFAGSDLHFVGHIVENREASAEEVDKAIKILNGEFGGCGGSCGGNCGGNCGGSCGDGGCGSCGDGGCGGCK
ncbi:MAG: FKBP-type peptidyl-prolyl cis-trans isomerase [Bacteroidaceae bacterium]|nr:FKBP-type peptidyl-prolyl cis-trans isomerase [Bacteroidaceae bacterium]